MHDERERAVDRLLKGGFDTPEAGMTVSCLDGETMAAFVDGGLSGAARRAAESHLADCSRCQTALGTLMRVAAIAPVPATRTPQHFLTSSLPRFLTSSLSRFLASPRRWLAWAVPLTAGAAALAIWVATPDRQSPVPGPQSSVASPQSSVTSPQSSVTSRASSGVGAQPSALSPQSGAAPASVGQEPGAAAGGSSPRQESGVTAGQRETTSANKPDQPRRDESRAVELRKEAPAAELDQLKDAAAQASAKVAAAPAAAPSAAPVSPAVAPPAAAVAREQLQRANALAAQPAAEILVTSPDPAVRWRLIGSQIERSTDAGATWQRLASGINSPLTAGAAPSATVFWAVGSMGVVVRTTDGATFSRIPFPEAADLSAVQSINDQTATVTATDGRTFTTNDGGRTWRPR